jgi:purine-cytosine permease-like protein
LDPRLRGNDESCNMSWQVLIMAIVAAVLTVLGAGLLLALTRPSGPAKIYVFRMVGIMLVSAGVVLGYSAWSMHDWERDPATSTSTPVPSE